MAKSQFLLSWLNLIVVYTIIKYITANRKWPRLAPNYILPLGRGKDLEGIYNCWGQFLSFTETPYRWQNWKVRVAAQW
jgi:hypothetical protein